MFSVMYDSMKAEDILVSVIIPAYNAEKYLAFSLDSVIAQTHNKLEIIVINDGSTDGTPKICDEYAKKDSRIKVIHQENKGLSSARNAALDIMTGEYIAFIDSDDFIESKSIEILLHDCIEYNSEIIIFGSIDTPEIRFIKHTITNNVKTFSSKFLLNNIEYISSNDSACTRFYQKSVFDALRFPPGKRYEDSFIAYETIENSKNVSFTDSKLYYYYLSPNSIMRSTFSEKNYDIFFSFDNKLEVLDRNKCEKSSQIVYRDYLYAVAGMIGQTKYCDKFSHEFKRKKVKELRKKYRELKKLNKDNPYFKGRFKLVSDLLYLFPIIKKIHKSSEG